MSCSRTLFEGELAKHYDLMHRHRDYEAESEFVHQLVQRLWPGADRVLGLCCGTGEHAVRMAQRGYKVTGVDMSHDMLDLARQKADAGGWSIDFRCQDLHRLEFSQEFQAAYCMGYTFHYMISYADVGGFLRNVQRSLLPSGILVVDFLNGWGLIEGFPRDKFVYRDGQRTVFQFEQTSLDRQRRVRHIEFFYVIQDGPNVRTASAEEDLRIFFEDEVMMLLERNGFDAVESFGGLSLDSPPTASSDAIVVVGRKKAD